MDAFPGVAGGDHVAWEEEDGVGFFAGASDASAELVEVGEAEAVGAVDEDGVGVGDIDAGFDDGGGEEDVGLVVDEGVHDVFEVVFFHLAVADEDACFGDEFGEAFMDLFDGFDAVVEEEDLAAAFHFAADGVADGAFVVGGDGGGDRESVGWWGVDGGHVAGAHECHVEGAGDGGCGECEDVDLAEEFFKFFFMGDSEALFFIDDGEAEIFVFDVSGDEAVGADDHVNGAVGEAFDGGADFGWGSEAVEEFDLDGVVGEAFAEGAPVLLGEDGGGAE